MVIDKIRVASTKKRITEHLQHYRAAKAKIGFVPTMGALHQGHLSLVDAARKANDVVVASVFINPTQFNNKEDLANYPRSLDMDLQLLETRNCDIVFTPSEDEIYPQNNPISLNLDLSPLDEVMEAPNRPGHFEGVTTVVKRLFDIIQPTNAYFGEKDYQQLEIIKLMANQLQISTNIVGCPIIREDNGLAMSSRNELLTKTDRMRAAFIYKVLQWVKKNCNLLSIQEIKDEVKSKFAANPHFELEYFEITNENTLMPTQDYRPFETRAFIAAFLGKVRLIDNVSLSN